MIRPILFALSVTCAVPLQAQTVDDLVRVEVLPGWQTADGTWMAALRIHLAPGWKTYWRAPGAAGIPPLFVWAGSENVSTAVFHWPVPEVFDQAGLRSIGYSGDVVIPIEVTAATPGSPPHLAGSVDLGICHDICVPVTLDFAADLASQPRRDPAIVAALVDRPMTATEAGVTAATCVLAQIAGGLSLTATLDLPSTGASEVVVIEAADPALWVSEPEVTREGGRLVARAEVLARDDSVLALDRSGLRFTVLGSRDAVDIQGCTAG